MCQEPNKPRERSPSCFRVSGGGIWLQVRPGYLVPCDGIEPPSRVSKTLILSVELTGHLERDKGIEPSPGDWKSAVLPLN